MIYSGNISQAAIMQVADVILQLLQGFVGCFLVYLYIVLPTLNKFIVGTVIIPTAVGKGLKKLLQQKVFRQQREAELWLKKTHTKYIPCKSCTSQGICHRTRDHDLLKKEELIRQKLPSKHSNYP